MQTKCCFGDPAPFWEDNGTLEYSKVTWELNSAYFSFLNPDWLQFLETLLPAVAGDLQVKGPFVIQPHKLLMYGPGSVVKAHKDTERVPNVFGTLVVCLPSQHEGGEVPSIAC